MIESLELKNFQSHIDTTVQFSSGLNVIYGYTDSGKSTIIKGLKLISSNRPSGNKYITKKKKTASLTLIADGNEIKRVRTKSKNEYIVNGTILKAIRTDVPEEVRNATQLSDINIQSQKDVWFLIDKSPGQINKELNKLIDLSIVDVSLKNVNSEIRSYNAEYKVILNDLRDIDSELMELENIEDANAFLSKLEKYQEKYINLDDEIDELNKLLESIKEAKTALSRIPNESFFKKADYLLKSKKIINVYEEEIKKLKYILDSIQKVKSKLNRIDLKELKSIENLNINAVYLYNDIKRIADIMSDIKSVKSSYTAIKKELAEKEKEYYDKLKRLGKCPTCGAEI
jgi:DNA repair exonuclease SbcCD ATPase subunit